MCRKEFLIHADGSPRRGPDMFNGNGSMFDRPINLDQVAAFNPLLAKALGTDEQLEEVTTNSLPHRRERSDE